jgi:hypothetical protein
MVSDYQVDTRLSLSDFGHLTEMNQLTDKNVNFMDLLSLAHFSLRLDIRK